ncbi:D-serine dehydratase [Pediococcus pentosaceus]|jgi:D-serine dehydratase|uniref:Probable D-serine dehydratase n=4 Tax=Pediococcus pentosaceus TaxID=1255 RepID=SDHD_PEDPA|nr:MULTISPECIES: D-serine ammonia-lyase [Pediococcus]Q03DF6.1 RecName: Full=Probable D-serine dehydratase; AltName: Full=D-serine deaminase; Short=DSD [Pediococcus pentosaceus ATCC 25745]ABJ68766.1 D-serine ammonia-lyase [Pediococcus pentosaceus ATCC 25745]AVL02176.1 D-serine dehydratase [Pediococcus pentosaceus]KAF5440080.1 D-serine ammonia-lyase [Pediococcus sp. EKM202D]KAF5440476.1 D-serine ammonia-lyase [Pediococcus sp. EKM201D]MBF7112998.1 D-serine ammonia-lyase [Pediococcus pentosaceus]
MIDVDALSKKYPAIKQMQAYEPIFWKNLNYKKEAELPVGVEHIFDAEARFQRFAPYFEVAFPETLPTHGILESPLLKMDKMKAVLNAEAQNQVKGDLYLKADNYLPISGSIKSRGGIYEVLKFAEKVAMKHGEIVYGDNYAKLNEPRFKDLFGQYGIVVGSTGNLGLSIGIVACKLGFRTSVHMSSDAAQWKKDMLREKGVNVVEYNDNFTHAITEARKSAEADPMAYFIDDEGSYDLFLGYSVAAVRLQAQLKAQNIKVDAEHPLFVYLPAGVGGSPSGVAFGLKKIIGENVHPIFAEPTHIPSVSLGMMTGLNDQISVYDAGIDGVTKADGLAVGRPSRIAGKMMDTLLYGIQTFDDQKMMKNVAELHDSENVDVEPSAASGFTILDDVQAQLEQDYPMENASHIVWATGGSMVPKNDMDQYVAEGHQVK